MQNMEYPPAYSKARWRKARDPMELWGKVGNTPQQRDKTDKDSLLILRQLHLTTTALTGNPDCLDLLEHPADPGRTAASFFLTEQADKFCTEVGQKSTGDQCRHGAPVPKTTTWIHNFPDFHDHVHNLYCDHPDGHKVTVINDSKILARWAPGITDLMAHNIVVHITSKGHPDDPYSSYPHNLDQQEGNPAEGRKSLTDLPETRPWIHGSQC